MTPSRQRGMTLVELMIAMVLGLIFIGGAIGLTLANKRSFNTNEGLSQVQEGSRTAFELLARDIRQAGLSGCDNTNRIANVIDTAGGTTWWQTWAGLQGYEGTQVSTAVAFGSARGERVADTDSVRTKGISGLGMSIESHDPATAELEINAASTEIVAGDVMIACDFDHAAIFQVSSYDAGDVALLHETAVAGIAPGNCSEGLGLPTVCTAAGTAYEFERNALVGRFAATEWYIGNSGRTTDSGRSLFRKRLVRGGLTATEEVVADVTDIQITYRVGNADDYVAADAVAVAAWANVNAVRIALTISSADARLSTDSAVNAGRLARSFTQVVTLRNRVL
jgi:type IV pilus assembly protein PilW